MLCPCVSQKTFLRSTPILAYGVQVKEVAFVYEPDGRPSGLVRTPLESVLTSVMVHRWHRGTAPCLDTMQPFCGDSASMGASASICAPDA